MSPICSWAVFGAFLIVGCASNTRGEEWPELEFRVDSTRLGEPLRDPALPVTLQAPLGWKPLPREVMAAVASQARKAAGADSLIQPRPIAACRQEPEGASLVVSGYPRRFSAAGRDSLAALHDASLRGGPGSAKVERMQFRHEGMEVIQWRVTGGKGVVFKLLGRAPDGVLFQLDFVIPDEVYMRELTGVESCIGSLQSP